MTTSTERLRALLDKRGVEHTCREIGTKKYTYWGEPMVNGVQFAEGNGWTEITIENPTPEQAIAATLGSEREAELEALAKDLFENATSFAFKGWLPYYKGRFAALGIEVSE